MRHSPSVFRPSATLASIALVALFLASPVLGESTLTFEERVRAQEAIERVYYSHLIGTSRSFKEAVSRSILERKVHQYLQESAALETLWETPVTAEMLRTETERIAASTRMPDRLRELFAALGNDPVLIQECLVRPTLVDRLARGHLSHDRRFQAHAMREAQKIRRLLESGSLSPAAEHPRRSILEVKIDDESAGGPAWREAAQVAVDAKGFAQWRSLLPSKPGEIGPVAEEDDAFAVRVMLASEQGRLLAAVYSIPKTSWEAWLPTVDRQLGKLRAATVADAAVKLDLLSALNTSDPSCQGDAWDNRSLAGPWPAEPGAGHLTWTGTHVIVWVWPASRSVKYDPVTDAWVPIATAGAPYTIESTETWTGSEMVVYGWNGGIPPVSTGGRYNPLTDTWRSMSFAGAPPARRGHTSIWTGSKMVISGGTGVVPYGPHMVDSTQIAGGTYDPATDTWGPGPYFSRSGHAAAWTGTHLVLWGGTCVWGWYQGDPCATEDPHRGMVVDLDAGTSWATTLLNVPSRTKGYSSVWTGSDMILWGGSATDTVGAGHRYDPVADTWTSTSQVNAPSGRVGHTAVWAEGEMIVWGGGTAGSPLADGGRYDPSSDTWRPVSTSGAPRAMNGHAAVWTGDVMVVWGGDPVTRGRYDKAADQWIPSGDPYVPPPRYGHRAVWTGNEMLVWPGERYDPALDTWRAISPLGAPRVSDFAAIWTGQWMVVWGGVVPNAGETNTGGRYDPTSDTWTATSTVNAPPVRRAHTAVWTGSEMIVWGGNSCQPYNTSCAVTDLQSGGRYDPLQDRWVPMTVEGSPQARSQHTAVWNGNRMIIWGGTSRLSTLTSGLNTGGVYDPQTDVWTATSVAGAPSGRYEHAAVSTGQEMIVWGGRSSVNSPCCLTTWHDSGGLYDPATDSWTPTSMARAPTARSLHTAVWNGNRTIIWGGQGPPAGMTSTGGLYDPAFDVWLPMSTVGAPSARTYHTSVWTGEEMILWGGSTPTGTVNTGGRYTPDTSPDGDGDGISTCAGDCDDADGGIYPGAPPVCDGLNNDCLAPGWPTLSGTNETDDDGDGLSECEGDCDDTRASVHPGAMETCDGLDTDCDGVIPAYEMDADHDGFMTCRGDCDDTDAAVGPNKPEVCDGKDNNCDGILMLGGESDADGDGYRTCAMQYCIDPYQRWCTGDCDDHNTAVYPYAPEICGDNLINSCIARLWRVHGGFCTTGTWNEVDDCDMDGFTQCQGDCNDRDHAVGPEAAEICDGRDNDCDGVVDGAGLDADGDGFGCSDDCDDHHATVHPGAQEFCDGLDNDCDGVVDGAGLDADGDGFGCPDDCDDQNPMVHPGAVDIPGDPWNQDCAAGATCDPAVQWGSHGAYVACVDNECAKLRKAGLLTGKQCDAIVTAAATNQWGGP